MERWKVANWRSKQDSCCLSQRFVVVVSQRLEMYMNRTLAEVGGVFVREEEAQATKVPECKGRLV